MTETTTLLSLPYIMPSQAQKHVTHNEALRMLDALVHLRVGARGVDTPPADPAEGDRWMVGAAPSGAFAGQSGNIAAFQDGAWAFHPPRAGWVIWDAAESALLVFDGAAWTPAFDPQNLPLLGVNTQADETNRLSVRSNATLLSHDGAGHQLKLNKAATGDTGSLLFQTGWSGRAEMGLAGDDNFSIKVSPDGAAWHSALTAYPATGNVSVPGSLGVGTPAPLMPLHVEGRMAVGDAIDATRIGSGTTGGTGRAFNLIDTNGAMRLWRVAGSGNSATIEFATGDGSNNITDASINRWDFGLTHDTNRFAIRRYTGASTADTCLAIQSNGRMSVGAAATQASAQFEVASTERGFLPPRMTKAQRDAVASPAEGLVIYNLTDHEPQFWNGSGWVKMAGA